MYGLSSVYFATTVHNATKWLQNLDFHVFAFFHHCYTLNYIFNHRAQPLTILFFQSQRTIPFIYTYYMKQSRLLRLVLDISYKKWKNHHKSDIRILDTFQPFRILVVNSVHNNQHIFESTFYLQSNIISN